MTSKALPVLLSLGQTVWILNKQSVILVIFNPKQCFNCYFIIYKGYLDYIEKKCEMVSYTL